MTGDVESQDGVHKRWCRNCFHQWDADLSAPCPECGQPSSFDRKDNPKPEGPPQPTDTANDRGWLARPRLLTLDQLIQMPPLRPLVGGLLDLDTLSVVYGRRESFKSFVALDLALSVAAGVSWHDQDTAEGLAVFVAAEGSVGLRHRVEAWQSRHDADPGDRFRVMPDKLNLLHPGEVEAFADEAAELGPSLVVIDTLARCIPGGDENSAKDVGLAIASLDTIRQRTGAHVLVVHHSGKGPGQGARGSSALEAAVDTVLEITVRKEIVEVATTKQKHRRHGPAMSFRPRTVGHSIVLEVASSTPQLGPKQLDALVRLADIEGDDGATYADWLATGVAPSTLKRTITQALELGSIERGPSGSDGQPRYRLTNYGRTIVRQHKETHHDQD